MNSSNKIDFWQKKLRALLHDPPSKTLNLERHEDLAQEAMRAAGLAGFADLQKLPRSPDHTASAADRLPFPSPHARVMHCAFDGVRSPFLHPLGAGQWRRFALRFHTQLDSVAGIEGQNSTQPVIDENGFPTAWKSDQASFWRAQFFVHWRLWPKFAREKDYRFAFLPADTRIPDHTIWCHMQVTSALATCLDENGQLKPAFLKFQIGPVQDFIAQARSTRDVWSGSYLLSWLMAVGLKELSEEVGPDVVIYPLLREQPLFDLMWRDELWKQVRINAREAWEFLDQRDAFFIPNLPNVFLAVVPVSCAAQLARKVEEKIRSEYMRIADSVWQTCRALDLFQPSPDFPMEVADREARFYRQVERFLSISWQVLPWPQTVEEALELAKQLPFSEGSDGDAPHSRVEKIIQMATNLMPTEHRDGRYYSDPAKTKLNNIGLAWSLLYAMVSWQLDAVRHTRVFRAWNTGRRRIETTSNKDALNGYEEAVASGVEIRKRCEQLISDANESDAKEQDPQRKNLTETISFRFQHDDYLGATTLIKRLWDLTYLSSKFDLPPGRNLFAMPNTYGLADHQPLVDSDGQDDAEDRRPGERYFAVLYFDGDRIGKWLMGDLCPPFETQLAEYSDATGQQRLGALPYFEQHAMIDFLRTRRAVSPSYHLQLSEALSNFALYCVRPIVEAYDGRLIYAGGDDVVAMLPADTALDCARALYMAFQGDPGLSDFLSQTTKPLLEGHYQRGSQPGHWLQKAAAGNVFTHAGGSPAHGFLARVDRVDQNGKPIPILVPGPNMTASVGIAVAHFKTPLQDVIRTARQTEKLAKDRYGRNAVAVTIMKHSGETTTWGARWSEGADELLRYLTGEIREERLSRRFPHRLAALLTPYLTGLAPLARDEAGFDIPSGFDPMAVFQMEVRHAVTQHLQVPRKKVEERSKLIEEYTHRLVQYAGRVLTRIDELLNDKQMNSRERLERFLGDMIAFCETVAFLFREDWKKTPLNNKNDKSGSDVPERSGAGMTQQFNV